VYVTLSLVLAVIVTARHQFLEEMFAIGFGALVAIMVAIWGLFFALFYAHNSKKFPAHSQDGGKRFKHRANVIQMILGTGWAFILVYGVLLKPILALEHASAEVSTETHRVVGDDTGTATEYIVKYKSSRVLMNRDEIDSLVISPLMEMIMRDNSECELDRRRLARKFYEDKQFDSAASIWDRLSDICVDAASCFYAGSSYYFAGNSGKAISLLEHSIQLEPELPAAYNNLGVKEVQPVQTSDVIGQECLAMSNR